MRKLPVGWVANRGADGPPAPPFEWAEVPAPPAEIGDVFIDRGACPGECCTYREWTATRDVDVVDGPDSARIVGRLTADEAVMAETGEVHVHPIAAHVRRQHALASGRVVSPGDVLWVLTPQGEGWSRVWFAGEFDAAEAIFACDPSCGASQDEFCWAVASDTRCLADPWWVRVRTKDGLVGWVDNTHDVLTGFDACG